MKGLRGWMGVIGRDECVVRAGVEAAVARATLRGDRCIVTVELERSDEFADEAVGAEGRANEERVAADPAEAGASRPELVGYRSRVNEWAGREIGVERLNLVKELEKHALHARVVVFAVGVLSDERRMGERLRRLVGEEERDDGFGARE